MAAAAAAAVMMVALVAEDPAVLRNAPRNDAPAQATLARGDWLEVRGEAAGFLKVYDHRRERPGYVRPSLVRTYRLDEAAAPELAAVVRFLRDAPGSESLGIGAAALALKAAPAGSDTSEILASIGTLADRLAHRVSARRADARDATLGAHLEVAESYGVKFKTIEAEVPGGKTRVCYDGEAWRAVLAAPVAPAVERARAALFLAGAASASCRPATASPAEERQWNDERIAALAAVDPGAVVAPQAGALGLSASLAGRVRLRRAEAFAWRAFDEIRRGGAAGGAAAARAEQTAIRELALSDRGVLSPEDLDLYEDVAVRVAASRFAVEAPQKDARKRAVAIHVVPRAPGESCVRVEEATGSGGGHGDSSRVLGERCTYGVVWESAVRWAASGAAATIAVQPLPAWTETWVVRRADDGRFTFETLTPATTDPDVGYVEAAGFSPDGERLLVVREARAGGTVTRRFQVMKTATLAVEIWASHADKLGAFKRWSSPSWRAGTLALR